MGCLGPLETSQKRNATFERIRIAAGPDSQIAPMQNIILSDAEIRALVIALADATEPPVPDRRQPLAEPLLLTRLEVAARLTSIFRPVDANPSLAQSVDALIQQYVTDQAVFFGGHCNLYDGCGVSEINAGQNPATSTVRSGLVIRTCLDLLALPRIDAQVLRKADLTTSSRVDAANVRALWDVFAPGRPLPDAVVNSVTSAANQQRSTVLQLFCRPSVLEVI